jgi:CRISPR-associated protein Csm2
MRDQYPPKSDARDAVPSWVSDVLKDVPAIIGDETQSELLVQQAKLIGNKIKNDVTSSQVRNIFGPVRQVQLRWRETTPQDEAEKAFRQVMLLRPKLAYQARRTNRAGFYSLEQILSTAIEEINKAKDLTQRYAHFRRFVEFFEAILAYHTAAGGK